MTFFNGGQGVQWTIVMDGNFGYGGIAVGDANNDGRWDAGYAMHHPYNQQSDFGNQMIEVALGDGSGRNWRPWDDGLAVARQGDDWYGMFGADFGDFDNDGLLDIAANSFGSGTGMHIYRNNGDGSWRDVHYFFGRNNSDMHINFCDLNNDGNLDVAAALHNHSLFFGDGRGNWEQPPLDGLPEQPFFGYLQGGDVGDVDGDGADDIAFCNSQYGMEVYKFDADNRRWVSLGSGLPRQANYYYMLDLCDMDGDGWLDIAASAPGGIEVWLQRPQGDPRWVRDAQIAFNNYIRCNALRAGGDVDHNGLPDIVALVNVRVGIMNDINNLNLLLETSEPQQLRIRAVEPRANRMLHVGAARFIDWISAVPENGPGRIDIDFSTRGENGPWTPVVADYPNRGRCQWRVPNVLSRDCRLRYRLTVGNETIEVIGPAFTISGGRMAPFLEVSPPRLDFGIVEDEESQNLFIVNSGLANFEFISYEFAVGEAFECEPPRLTREVLPEPGDTLTITVICRPPAEGFWSDTLRFDSDGGTAQVVIIARTPNAVGPRLEWESDTLHFGRLHIDSLRILAVKLYSRGDTDALCNIAGSPGGVFRWDAVPRRILPVGDSLQVQVSFLPILPISYNTALAAEYQLGAAILPAVGTGFGRPMLIVCPDTLDFGRVLVRDIVTCNVWIASVGDEDARVSILSPQGAAYRWSAVNDTVLAFGDTLHVDVQFQPQLATMITGLMRIIYQIEELQVELRGEGFRGPLVETSSDTVDFGDANINFSIRRDLILRNRSFVDAVVSIPPSRASEFQWQRLDTVIIRSRDSLTLPLYFTPRANGEYFTQMEVIYQDNRLEVFLFGRGHTEWGISREESAILSDLALNLAPNPFNKSITIVYSLPTATEVSLKILNLNCREAALIERSFKPAGVYRQVWSDPNLPAGVYFCRLQAGRLHRTAKVVLVK